jgi:hypothetical protein
MTMDPGAVNDDVVRHICGRLSRISYANEIIDFHILSSSGDLQSDKAVVMAAGLGFYGWLPGSSRLQLGKNRTLDWSNASTFRQFAGARTTDGYVTVAVLPREFQGAFVNLTGFQFDNVTWTRAVDHRLKVLRGADVNN